MARKGEFLELSFVLILLYALSGLALAKHGYEKARRIGMMAMVGGKNKTRIRNATPPQFRDLLLSIARSCACG